MKIVLVSAVILLGMAQAEGADFDFKVWSHNGNPSPSVVTATLDRGASLLASSDGDGDTACPNQFHADVNVVTDALLPSSVSSEGDWLKFLSDDRFSIYVVRNILWCGGPAVGGVFAGCARKGGPIAITGDFFNPVVVTHEIGHAQGNLHNQTQQFLMFPRAKATNTRVTSGECDKFLIGQLFPVMVEEFPYMQDDGAPPMAAMADAAVDLGDLLESFWHTPPVDEIALLDDSDIDRIRAILDGEPSALWPNALTILGLRGEADDFVFLEKAIAMATEGLSAGEADLPLASIRTNAEIALGMLYNRTEEVALLDSLRLLMTAPQSVFPSIDLPAAELEDIVKSAAVGFAHAGPTASLTFPAALAQAQISNLQIAAVFSADGAIVATLPDQRDVPADASTNPSQAILAAGAERDRAATAITSIESFYDMVGDIKTQVDAEGLQAYLAAGAAEN